MTTYAVPTERAHYELRKCPFCAGEVVPDERFTTAVVKECRECGEVYAISLPMLYNRTRHVVADAISWRLYRLGLTWGAIAVVMATEHDIQMTAQTWQRRAELYYGFKGP